MALKAGRLRHLIEIQRPVSTQNETTGEFTTSWQSVVRELPAEVIPVSVREFIASRTMQSEVTARITIRYREGLTAAMRILHRGRVYNPLGWLPDPDSGIEYLTAPCTEGLNDG